MLKQYGKFGDASEGGEALGLSRMVGFWGSEGVARSGAWGSALGSFGRLWRRPGEALLRLWGSIG